MSHDPTLLFPTFYSNPAIKQLARHKSWTISTKNKVPIDMVTLLSQQRIYGARYANDQCLVDLDTITKNIPHATNVAYHIDVCRDEFIIIDIESSASDERIRQLMTIPHVYAETSMSGKGYHLLAPLPRNFNDFPHVLQKTKLKSHEGDVELLLNHYCTFTRHSIDTSHIQTDDDFYCKLFDELAHASPQNTHISSSRDLYIDIDNDNDIIPNDDDFDILMSSLEYKTYAKSVEDFHGDFSRYEFGYLSFIQHKIRLYASREKKTDIYTNKVVAYVSYCVAKDVLPYRDKHHEYRDGMPWLLYNACVIADRYSNDNAT